MHNSPLQLLHIEDDSTDAFLMHEMLQEGMGTNAFNITQVDSLTLAIKTLQKSSFDIILLDLNLRDIRGTDNISAIIAESPSTPVIVLTGVDNQDAATNAITLGAQDYIIKGHCNPTVMRLAINSSIERKKHELTLFKHANYDEITGLPNRRLFIGHLRRSITNAQRNKGDGSLIFVSINKLNDINIKYGYEGSNKLALEVTKRIQNSFDNF